MEEIVGWIQVSIMCNAVMFVAVGLTILATINQLKVALTDTDKDE